MARRCTITGTKPMSGHNVSHANNKTKRRWLPNLRRVHIVTDVGERMHVRVCTRCLSAGKIRKA